MNCGKGVSTEVPEDTIVRAWVECPECLERKSAVAPLPETSPGPMQASRLGDARKEIKFARDKVWVLSGADYNILRALELIIEDLEKR
jgi:hypothetical protein